MARFEYKFVKLKVKAGVWWDKPEEDYHQVIEEHARDGWRLRQLFAPSTGWFGMVPYYELIFEKAG